MKKYLFFIIGFLMTVDIHAQFAGSTLQQPMDYGKPLVDFLHRLKESYLLTASTENKIALLKKEIFEKWKVQIYTYSYLKGRAYDSLSNRISNAKYPVLNENYIKIKAHLNERSNNAFYLTFQTEISTSLKNRLSSEEIKYLESQIVRDITRTTSYSTIESTKDDVVQALVNGLETIKHLLEDTKSSCAKCLNCYDHLLEDFNKRIKGSNVTYDPPRILIPRLPNINRLEGSKTSKVIVQPLVKKWIDEDAKLHKAFAKDACANSYVTPGTNDYEAVVGGKVAYWGKTQTKLLEKRTKEAACIICNTWLEELKKEDNAFMLTGQSSDMPVTQELSDAVMLRKFDSKSASECNEKAGDGWVYFNGKCYPPISLISTSIDNVIAASKTVGTEMDLGQFEIVKTFFEYLDHPLSAELGRRQEKLLKKVDFLMSRQPGWQNAFTAKFIRQYSKNLINNVVAKSGSQVASKIITRSVAVYSSKFISRTLARGGFLSPGALAIGYVEDKMFPPIGRTLEMYDKATADIVSDLEQIKQCLDQHEQWEQGQANNCDLRGIKALKDKLGEKMKIHYGFFLEASRGPELSQYFCENVFRYRHQQIALTWVVLDTQLAILMAADQIQ